MPAKPKILVTGAASFLGAHVARALSNRGFPVRGTRQTGDVTDHLSDVDLEWADVDPDAPKSVEEALGGCRAVIDCSPHGSPDDDGAESADAAKRRGVGRLRTLVEACKRQRIGRFVYLSNATTLGTGSEDDSTPLDEDHFYAPGEVEAPSFEAAWSMEAELYRYVLDDFLAVILIPGAMLGPGEVDPLWGKLLIFLARGRLPTSVGGTFNVVDVRDVANTAVNAIQRGRPGRRYVLGGHNLQVSDFLRRAGDLLGVEPPSRQLPTGLMNRGTKLFDWLDRTVLPEGLTDRRLMLTVRQLLHARPLTSERAEGELDHQARGIDTTLRDAVQWLRTNGHIESGT